MWVFNSKRELGCCNFFIGQVQIASVRFVGPKGAKTCVLTTASTTSDHETFSSALTELHRLLNSAPDESHSVP